MDRRAFIRALAAALPAGAVAESETDRSAQPTPH